MKPIVAHQRIPVFIAGFAALLCAPLFAGTLNVTVRDPVGALVVGASVAVTDRILTTDNHGRATFLQLPAASYPVSVTKQGFSRWDDRITVGGQTLELAVSLKLDSTSTRVRVSARRSPLANSDPNYQALRNEKLIHVHRVSNLVLNRDAGVFTFRSGSFSFLPPVMGRVTVGVFVGDGNFQLKPGGELATVRMKRMMGSESVNEDFTALVIYFSDSTYDEVKSLSESVDESPEKHEEALKRVRGVIRERREPRNQGSWPPRSQMESLLNDENIPNYEAEVLAEVYNGAGNGHPGSFRAFLHGKKYGDLRFLMNPLGALPVLDAREEVAALNFDPNSNSDGIWYLAHTLAEQRAGPIDPHEEKRIIAPEHYKIETLIGDKNLLGIQPDLAVTCSMSFRPLEDGVRMVKFDLIPDLQVSRVVWNGQEIPFVQEGRNRDGSFYLETPQPLSKGRVYEATIDYAGGEILQSAHGFVPLRRVWYPTPSGAASRATYDLTFRIPHGSAIVTVGNRVRESKEDKWDVSEWAADTPIEQAVFRWLQDPTYKTAVEETTRARMSLYYVFSGSPILPPTKNEMLIDVGNGLRVFHTWFGKPAFDNIDIVMQANAPSGSLPGLVFLAPILAAGYGSVNSQIGVLSRGGGPGPAFAQMRPILDEAFPKLLAGQWWGNTVSPASFHDQWLIAGLTNFSASVYDFEMANGDFNDRWEMAREGLLGANRMARIRANDAGPVSMGLLNDTPATKGSSSQLRSSKGAYILHMLCAMMWDPETGDRDFKDMMRDFVVRFANHAVSTEDFQSVVNGHVKPAIDLDGTGKMDWFFNQWVYQTAVPSYRLEYSLTAAAGGTMLLEGRLTQSGVTDSFQMPVPIYADYSGKKGRICLVTMRGNATGKFSASLTTKPKQILLNVNHDVLSEKDIVSQVKAGR